MRVVFPCKTFVTNYVTVVMSFKLYQPVSMFIETGAGLRLSGTRKKTVRHECGGQFVFFESLAVLHLQE